MNKQEVIKFFNKHYGFVPHKILFDLFNDDEEIPEGLIEAECHYFDPPQPMILMVGAGLYKKLKEEGIF